MHRVLITDWVKEISDIERDVFDKVPAEIIVGNCKSTAEVVEKGKDVEVLLVDSVPIGKEVFLRLEKLKAVVKYGIGIDNIDIKGATETGVQVVNVPAMITEVAEHTVGLILSLARKIPLADRKVRSGEWKDKSKWLGYVPKLRGKTIGIVGLGRTGRLVASILKSFDVNIIGYDPFLRPEDMDKLGVKPRSFKEVLKESDVVTLHVPLTESTKYMIGERELRSMKKTAIIVNCARGSLIDQTALFKALTEDWIEGAALDVFSEEPVSPGEPLLKLDNLIATPHMAWFSYELPSLMRRLAAEEAARVLRGERPINLVNPEVLKNAR